MGGARVRVRMVPGPLAPWAAGFDCWLGARGYASRSVYHRVCQLSSLSRWLERFLDARRAAGRGTWVSSRCLALPLEYLREVGAVPESVPAVVGDAMDELLEGYREYLLLERGLACRTIVEYQRTARLFLEQRSDASILAMRPSGFSSTVSPSFRPGAGAQVETGPGIARSPAVWIVRRERSAAGCARARAAPPRSGCAA